MDEQPRGWIGDDWGITSVKKDYAWIGSISPGDYPCCYCGGEAWYVILINDIVVKQACGQHVTRARLSHMAPDLQDVMKELTQ